MVAKTGTCVPKLTKSTARATALKLAEFYKGEMMNRVFIKFLEEGLSKNLYSSLTVEENNFILSSLEKIADHSIHHQSAAYQLYKKYYYI